MRPGDLVMTAYGAGRLVGYERKDGLLFGRPHRELWFLVEFDDGGPRMLLPHVTPEPEKHDAELGERNGRDDER